jgi:hypothetical protein
MTVSPSIAADGKVVCFEGRHCRLLESAFQLLAIWGRLQFIFRCELVIRSVGRAAAD